MRLSLYEADSHAAVVASYQLADATFTASPDQVITDCQEDRERYPLLLWNDEDELVGCFCLHVGKGPEQYGFSGQDYGLIRSFSIDDRYRRRGYALTCFRNIFEQLSQLPLPGVSRLVLAVNEKNLPAQAVYEQAGFTVVQRGAPGLKGNLLIMEKRQSVEDRQKL